MRAAWRVRSLGWATVHDISQLLGSKWFDPRRFGEEFKDMLNPVEAYEKHISGRSSRSSRAWRR
jgi:hypothetical protein